MTELKQACGEAFKKDNQDMTDMLVYTEGFMQALKPFEKER